jgi:hypothetical protein
MAWLVPEFIECWWDSVFFDFLGANMVGLLLGMGLMHVCGGRSYNWFGFRKPVVDKETPYELPHEIEYQWRFADDWHHLSRCVGMLGLYGASLSVAVAVAASV